MLQIDFINVGSGDAALVRVNDYAALIDCGNVTLGDCRPGSCRILAADYLREEGVSRLDLIVLTHLHRDHIGGFQKVLETVRAGEVWTSYLPSVWPDAPPAVPEDFPKKARGLGKSLALYVPALRLARAQGVRLREVASPAVGIPLTADLTADIGCLPAAVYRRQSLALDHALCGKPEADELQAAGAALNEASLRLTLHYHGQTVLLPGDAYGAGWKEGAVPCTVFKVPHHGSGQSLDRELAQKLSPETAVISCGAYREDNRPNPDVVRWLCEASGAVHCTDACAVPGLSGENHRAVRVRLA